VPEPVSRLVSGRRFLLALALWAGLGGAALGATLLGARGPGHAWAAAHRADLVAIALAEAYLALLLALLVAFGGPMGLRDRLGFRFTSLRDLLLALLTWVVCLFLGGLLTNVLEPVLGPPQSNAEPILGLSFDALFVGLVVPTICLLAPAGEELLFRGALFGWLRRRLPALLVIPITGAVFAGVHLLPSLLPVLFVFGLGAAWVRERTGSTFNSFAMHATQNTLAVLATYALLSRRG
jgi:membrane protease YdiL (CAAX protease family)